MDQVRYVLKDVLVNSGLEELVNKELKGLEDKEIVDIKFQTTENLMASVVQIHYRDDMDDFRKAALTMNRYIEKYVIKTGGESWWVDHNGITHTDDVGYFIELWNHILKSFGLEEV